MANCNECENIEIVIEKDGSDKYTNHMCKKHGISLRYQVKRFLGFIWPCVECNGEDFEKGSDTK
jgi:ribosomal protein L37AE/L43A